MGKRALRDPERASKEFLESKLWQENEEKLNLKKSTIDFFRVCMIFLSTT